jgi:hypothetical protein
MNSVIYRLTAGEDISLSGGASIQFSIFLKPNVTFPCRDEATNDEGDPLGSPSLRAAMPLCV